MSSGLLALLSLVLLYFSTKSLLKQFSLLIHQLGGNRNFLIGFWSLIFFVGTVVHEMSHFLFAILVGARTGKIELLPRFLEERQESEDRNDGVTLGYVQTQKLNFFQGFFVGLAPLFVGLPLLIWLASNITDSYYSGSYSTLAFQIYLFFTVSNSFFPSRTDLKHVWVFALVFLGSLVLLWLFGLNFTVAPSPYFYKILNTISYTLLFSFGCNLFIIFCLYLTRLVFRSKYL